MNSKLFLGLVSIPLAGLMLWTGYIEYQSRTLPEVTVPIQGFDPRSLLSGHYISYRIDWKKTDCRQFAENKCPTDDEFYDYDSAYSWGGYYGQHRFYIPQEKAKDLDNMFLKSTQNGDVFEVVYAYKKGFQPIAKRLLINGNNWQEALKNHNKNKL